MSQAREYVSPTWDMIYDMLLETALRIKRSGFKPDLIVGVSRGGWAPGRVLSDLLANAHTANVKIEFYVGIGKTSGKPIVTQPISENISQKNVLVVDDVADTGESLLVALDHVREKGAAEIKTATIYHKPHSKFKPDYFAETTSKWIIFPWERLEATRLLIHDANAEGRSMDSVRATLRQCKIDDKEIDALFRLANGGT
ncbi:MAG TPA: phosphoribosyltransferase [Candidatus Acidoferrales bacterium]|nr:phosphoribosyltransferase [Candidatus Acidoferrales bacterium]